MSDYDQQISESIKQLDAVNQRTVNLAEALKEINKVSNRTYGLATGLKPQRGIYYIENGIIKTLNELYKDIDSFTMDKIKDFELINTEEKKSLKIIYANNKELVIK